MEAPLTLAEQFDDYIAKVYTGETLPADQLAEVRNAFMAGCCLAYTDNTDYSAEIKGFFESLNEAVECQERGENKRAEEVLERWTQLNRRSRRSK